jgi:hypothetical protein
MSRQCQECQDVRMAPGVFGDRPADCLTCVSEYLMQVRCAVRGQGAEGDAPAAEEAAPAEAPLVVVTAAASLTQDGPAPTPAERPPSSASQVAGQALTRLVAELQRRRWELAKTS